MVLTYTIHKRIGAPDAVYVRSRVGDVTKMTWSRYWKPFCHAWAKSRNRPCRRRVGYRRDGSLRVVCPSHRSKTPPYSERPISEAGKAHISAAAKAMYVAPKFEIERAPLRTSWTTYFRYHTNVWKTCSSIVCSVRRMGALRSTPVHSAASIRT
jgi:hypothetical protein